jgi:hypothetical protein
VDHLLEGSLHEINVLLSLGKDRREILQSLGALASVTIPSFRTRMFSVE